MANVSFGTPAGSQSGEPASTPAPPPVIFTTQHTLNRRGTTSASDELVVVMPTRVRVDSRVVLSHCTTSWLSNCALCILILAKLDGWTDASWWLVFVPCWIHHFLQIPLQCAQLYFKEYFVQKQLGPPPPEESSPGLQLQYNMLRSSRMRTFIIDVVNQGLEGLGLVTAKLLFVFALEKKWTNGASWASFRVIFSPVWATWIVITCLSCLKNRHERILGGARDLTFLFLLFVAFKLDNQSSYSWRLVFLIPWMWFSAMFLLTCMVFVLLLFARAWTRLSELVLPLGFFFLLLSCVPQFISYIALVDKLDGNTEVSNRAILIPNATSWFMMWLSSIVVCRGLFQKEELRASLQAAGAVWTASEQIARQMHQTMEAAQKRIDDLTEGEIANLVQEMMQGKTKPSHLVKIGGALFKRMSAGLGQGSAAAKGGIETIKDAQNLLSVVNQEGDMIGTTIELFALPHEVSTPPGTCDANSPTSSIHECQDLECSDSTTANLQAGVVLDVDPEVSKELFRAPSSTNDDRCCIICYDGTATCVFLECGHGGFCRRCANKLFVRPPNECPTCRQKIEQVVIMESSVMPLHYFVPICMSTVPVLKVVELTVSGEIGEVLTVK